MSNLYIVATPIGNLEDITLRALRVLKEVDFILCEDTRVTGKLLEHHGIDTGTISYHQHSRLSKVNRILEFLKDGKDLALVSDSGTPGVSDPGGKLVEQVYQELGDKVEIESVPGPSAVTAALSISGLPADKFLFLGFPPKKKRNRFFQEVKESSHSVVIYESPHRIIKTLNDIRDVVDGNTRIFVGRELTKKFESLYRGKVGEVIQQVKNDPNKGEYTVIIEKG